MVFKIQRVVAQDLDPWNRIRHVFATAVEEDSYHYFITGLERDAWNNASNYAVLVYGDQYIDGIKYFEQFPYTPEDTPYDQYHVANKVFVETSVNFNNLNNNGDIGIGSNQVAYGDHDHSKLPTQDEKDAMDSSYFPSIYNPFVTAYEFQEVIDTQEFLYVDSLYISYENTIPYLSYIPIDNTLFLTVTNIVAYPNLDYTLEGNHILWLGNFTVDNGDRVLASYAYLK